MDVLSIHSALRLACSQDPNKLKTGEQQLKSWEKEKGYYAGLASVFSDRNVDPIIRWMAITCLKNGVDTYWRPTAPNAIKNEEKDFIRKVLLNGIEETEQKISLQLAAIIAKVGRSDYPHHWPDLLSVLAEKVRSESPVIQKCGLLTLREVTKSFSSWRLAEQRLSFYEITGNLFSYITQIWVNHLSSVSGFILQGCLDEASDSFSLANISLKVLQLMLLHGFARFNVDTNATKLVDYLFELAPQSLLLRSQLPADHPSFQTAEETATMIIKTLFKLQRNHPIGYISFLEHSFQLIDSTIFNPLIKNQMYDGFVIYGLSLIKSILRCEDYAIPPSIGNNKEVSVPIPVLEAQKIKNDFFTRDKLNNFLHQIVTKYMLLTSEDLEKWEDSPEEYIFSEENVGQLYMFSMKGSTEGVLMAILHELTSTAAPIVMQMIAAVQDTTTSSDWSSLLVKEAVYNAVGLVAFDLYQYLDFDSWFQNHLVKELLIMEKKYSIVRRRVLWILGCWVGVKFDASNHPVLYQCILSSLHPEDDIVVKLTAVDALKQVIDDVAFTAETISLFIPNLTELLLLLLKQLKCSETKLLVMNVFSMLIERVGSSIQPYIGSLLELIPHMWMETLGDNSSLLRSIIIGTLTHTINSLGSLSIQIHSFVIPVIQGATDIKQSEHLYLAEDGLDLWKALLHNAPVPSLELAMLLCNMSDLLGLSSPNDDSTSSLEGLMDIGSSSLLVCFGIMEAYVVLFAQSPDIFMQHCSDVIVKSCATFIQDVKQTGVEAIVNVLDCIMVAYPSHSYHILQPILLQLLNGVLSGQETYSPTLCLYLTVLARAMLCNAQHFLSLLQLLVQRFQQEVDVLLGMLLDIWAYRLDNIGEIKRRKTFGLAAASLLTINDQCVQSRFGSLLDMCVEVLHDVTDVSTTGGQFDCLVIQIADIQTNFPSSTDSEHRKRIRQLKSDDPVWVVSLPQLVMQQLETCLTTLGMKGYQTLLCGVDIVVREQLTDFLPPEKISVLLVLDV